MKEKYTEESKVQPVTNTAYEAKTKYRQIGARNIQVSILGTRFKYCTAQVNFFYPRKMVKTLHCTQIILLFRYSQSAEINLHTATIPIHEHNHHNLQKL